MSSILFSITSGNKNNAIEAIDFLKKNKIIAWGSNIRIIPEKFSLSKLKPLIGYINYESKVRYKVEIIDIIRFDKPHIYPNVNERPNKWENGEWKTFFRFKKMEKVDPIDTLLFKKINGEYVKHHPQNYVEIVD